MRKFSTFVPTITWVCRLIQRWWSAQNGHWTISALDSVQFALFVVISKWRPLQNGVGANFFFFSFKKEPKQFTRSSKISWQSSTSDKIQFCTRVALTPMLDSLKPSCLQKMRFLVMNSITPVLLTVFDCARLKKLVICIEICKVS